MKITCTCTNCGKKIKRIPSSLKKINNPFCSQSCAATYNGKLYPKRKKEHNYSCITCGTRVDRRRTKQCMKCRRTTSPTRNYTYSERSETSKESSKQAVVKYRQNQKLKAVAYLGGKCKFCNYDKSVTALSFHHRNPEEKEFSVSNVTMKWDRLLPELDKCDLVCQNCHREIHYKTSKTPHQSTILRRKLKETLVNEFGGSCSICGYNKCLAALDFHHRNPSDKSFRLSGVGKTLDKLKKEANKCNLLCANCHSEYHSS